MCWGRGLRIDSLRAVSFARCLDRTLPFGFHNGDMFTTSVKFAQQNLLTPPTFGQSVKGETFEKKSKLVSSSNQN